MHWMSKLFVSKEIPDAVGEALAGISKERKLVETFTGSTMDNKENLSDSTMALILSLYEEGSWLYEQEILGRVVTQGSGALGNRHWFDGKVLYQKQESVRKRVRYWDLAATEKKAISQKRYVDPDETVGTLMSFKKLDDGTLEFYIEDQVCGHWEWDDILHNITETALNDGQYVEIWIEQEPGAGGKNQVAAIFNHIRDNLPGWGSVQGHNPRDLGDKVMRANHWFKEASNGNIYLVAGEWNEPFLKQLSSFPLVKHDDKVDSVSGARAVLAPFKKWKTIPFMAVGVDIDYGNK
jgi:predicted phage terminase large subunit-like protein